MPPFVLLKKEFSSMNEEDEDFENLSSSCQK